MPEAWETTFDTLFPSLHLIDDQIPLSLSPKYPTLNPALDYHLSHHYLSPGADKTASYLVSQHHSCPTCILPHTKLRIVAEMQI